MPGPKMGPRPPDFDEDLLKQAPTYLKWQQLEDGEKLRYACREFIKGRGDDDERLLRRLMIARRNNIKDHEELKQARQQQQTARVTSIEEPKEKKRRFTAAIPDEQVAKEMHVAAVVATRSYRTWTELADGQEFIYNQKYIKGKEGHDWLLRKNIWRRMRYRRENKKLMQRYTGKGAKSSAMVGDEELSSAAAGIVDHALLQGDESFQKSSAAAAAAVVESAVVESALAAADSYVKAENLGMGSVARVHNPLDATTATSEALDAAAKLAAANASQIEGTDVAQV